MKKVYYVIMLFILAIMVSCEKQEEDLFEQNSKESFEIFENSNQQKNDVVLNNEGYLSFKNQEAYLKISQTVDKMTDEEYETWQRNLGFESASTFIANVEEQIESIQTNAEFNALKEQYSSKLIFMNDCTVKLPFYASAWGKVLSVDGIMKIGNTLYKFCRDREFIVSDGSREDLENLEALEANTSKCRVFYPQQEVNNSFLKSINWGTLEDGQIKTGSSRGDSKLDYSLQLISFNYTGYGYSTTQYTEAGFELKMRFQQKRKGIFGWYKNKTSYCLRNIEQHIEYYEPEHWYNRYVNDVYIGRFKEGGDHVVIDESKEDVTYSNTKYGFTYSFYHYYFVDQYDWSHVEPEIYNFNCTFWSNGIGYDLRETITCSNL